MTAASRLRLNESLERAPGDDPHPVCSHYGNKWQRGPVTPELSEKAKDDPSARNGGKFQTLVPPTLLNGGRYWDRTSGPCRVKRG